MAFLLATTIYALISCQQEDMIYTTQTIINNLSPGSFEPWPSIPSLVCSCDLVATCNSACSYTYLGATHIRPDRETTNGAVSPGYDPHHRAL